MSSLTDQVLYRFLRTHDAIYQRTGGWIGHRLPGMPNSLLLHTVGAKTGAARTTTLTYARDGENYLIVASNGGSPRYPGWYHNLRARAEVQVNVGPRRFGARAEVVGPDNPDYQRMWELTNRNNANRYRAYQKRTSRPIPVVVLTPR